VFPVRTFITTKRRATRITCNNQIPATHTVVEEFVESTAM